MRFHMPSLPCCKPRGTGPLVSAPKRPSPHFAIPWCLLHKLPCPRCLLLCSPNLLFLSSLSSGHRLGRRIGPWERSRTPSFSRSLHQHCVILSGRRRLMVGTCYSPLILHKGYGAVATIRLSSVIFGIFVFNPSRFPWVEKPLPALSLFKYLAPSPFHPPSELL